MAPSGHWRRSIGRLAGSTPSNGNIGNAAFHRCGSSRSAPQAGMMKIRVGYELVYDFPQPMIMVHGVHYTRAPDILVPDYLTTDPAVNIAPYRDLYGN
jgi:hypothetical protein